MRSKILVLVGLLLVGGGATALSYGGIPYKSRDVVIDLGPLSATAESNRTWPVPPAASGLAIAAGIVMIVIGARKS